MPVMVMPNLFVLIMSLIVTLVMASQYAIYLLIEYIIVANDKCNETTRIAIKTLLLY